MSRPPRGKEQAPGTFSLLLCLGPTLLAQALLPGCLPGTGTTRPWELPPSAVPGEAAARDVPSVDALPPPGESSLGPLPLEDPLQTLLEAARRLNRLRTLRGFLDQRLIVNGQSVDLHIRFFFSRRDRIRYEHVAPLQQVLVSDGRTLWLLPPRSADQPGPDGGEPQWLARPLSSLSVVERSALGLVPGYGFDPLAPLPVDGHLFRFTRRTPELAEILLEPAERTPGPRQALAVEVAPRLGAVTQLRQLDGAGRDATTCVTRYDDFRQVQPGVYFPFRSRTRWSGQGTEIVVESRFADLRINEPIDEARFLPR